MRILGCQCGGGGGGGGGSGGEAGRARVDETRKWYSTVLVTNQLKTPSVR